MHRGQEWHLLVDDDQKTRGSACLQKGNVAVCSLAIAPHWY
jgi:hypothetical protein